MQITFYVICFYKTCHVYNNKIVISSFRRLYDINAISKTRTKLAAIHM